MPTLEAVNTAPHRTDSWAAHALRCAAGYRIVAQAEPALLCQVLNLFALQYLVPRSVDVARQDSLLTIDVAIDGLSWHRAQVIAEKMRNLIDVYSVELTLIDSVDHQHHHVVMAAG